MRASGGEAQHLITPTLGCAGCAGLHWLCWFALVALVLHWLICQRQAGRAWAWAIGHGWDGMDPTTHTTSARRGSGSRFARRTSDGSWSAGEALEFQRPPRRLCIITCRTGNTGDEHGQLSGLDGEMSERPVALCKGAVEAGSHSMLVQVLYYLPTSIRDATG